jgi:hypothetical protein
LDPRWKSSDIVYESRSYATILLLSQAKINILFQIFSVFTVKDAKSGRRCLVLPFLQSVTSQWPLLLNTLLQPAFPHFKGRVSFLSHDISPLQGWSVLLQNETRLADGRNAVGGAGCS